MSSQRLTALLARCLALSVPVAFAASPAMAETTPDPQRLEVGLVPALSFDSNLGLGLGAFLALTRFDPRRDPHRFRFEALAQVSLRADGDDGFQLPVQAYYVDVDAPEVVPRLRLRARISFFAQENTNYFGLGSQASKLDDQPEPFHQYERINPGVNVSARYRLVDVERPKLRNGRLEVFVGLNASYSDLRLNEGSLLANHASRAQSPVTPDDRVLSDLLHGTEDHFLLVGRVGLLLDLRDNEFHPETGGFHTIGLRFSPGVDASLDYLGLSASTAWFIPFVPHYLVLATRLAGDLIVGEAPFYELASFGSFQPMEGPGGADSVRGLLLRRFHGKAKLVGNVEFRSEFIRFRAFEAPFVLGAIAFTDAGRVWADFRPRTFEGIPLDGSAGDIQLGVGGGLRLRWGDTFIIRGDYGVSPTDGTTGLYISVNHIF